MSNSKFRRVAETEKLPGIMEQTFVGNSQNEDDPYAYLRESKSQRRVKIAQEENAFNKEASARANSYNFEDALRNSMPQYYQQDNRIDDQGLILNHKAIRRSSYDYDDGENGRDLSGTLKAFSDSDYMTVMMRGASIFDPQFEDIESILQSSADQDNKLFDQRTTREIVSDRRNNWEREALTEIQQQQNYGVRACSILRTGTENVATGAFGIMDSEALYAAEERRIASAEAKRTQRLAIKRDGKTLEEKRTEWEQYGVRPTELRDVYSSANFNLSGVDEIDIE